MATWPGRLRITACDYETTRRNDLAVVEVKAKCERCHGKDFIPVQQNYTPQTLPAGFVGSKSEVPCLLCQNFKRSNFQTIMTQVRKELGIKENK